VSLHKRPVTERSIAVEFDLPAAAAAESVQLVGEFNGWNPIEMTRTDTGAFNTVVELDAGSAYRFRYRLDGSRWENDWAADGYVANDFGGDDSVVDLTVVPSAAGTEPPKRRRRAVKQPPAATESADKPTKRKRSPRKAAEASDQ
jgi:1,4-alpha-glucan branching enzyme